VVNQQTAERDVVSDSTVLTIFFLGSSDLSFHKDETNIVLLAGSSPFDFRVSLCSKGEPSSSFLSCFDLNGSGSIQIETVSVFLSEVRDALWFVLFFFPTSFFFPISVLLFFFLSHTNDSAARVSLSVGKVAFPTTRNEERKMRKEKKEEQKKGKKKENEENRWIVTQHVPFRGRLSFSFFLFPFSCFPTLVGRTGLRLGSVVSTLQQERSKPGKFCTSLLRGERSKIINNSCRTFFFKIDPIWGCFGNS